MKIVENILEKRRTLFPSKLAAFAAATLVASAFALFVGTFTTPQAVAQTPSGGSSGIMFAVGGFALTGMDSDGITHVAFAAQENPTTVNTKNPSFAGYVVQETTSGVRSGPVLCMNVSETSSTSSNARIVWTVKHTNIPKDTIGQRSFDVTDNGDPVMGVSMDVYKDNGFTDNTCPTTAPMGTISGEMLVSGNIVVSP